MCYMNARKERGSDFENFGTRITRFGVVVETIWNFEVSGLFLWIFLRLGTFLELIRYELIILRLNTANRPSPMSEGVMEI
jgi:hypothetical protein